MTLDVNASDFQREVLDRSHAKPVVVDFWAPWCGPCRTLGPILEKLERESAGQWILVKVNTDDNQSLGQSFSIQGIPAVKAFIAGRVVDEFVGALPEARVRAWLEGFVEAEGTGPESILAEARGALAGGDKAAATAALSRLGRGRIGAHGAQVAIVEFGIEAQEFGAVEAAFAADPQSPSARYALGVALAAGGAWESALEHFFALFVAHRAVAGDAARKAMLRVFDAAGIRSELSVRWRSKLSSELYP